MPRRFESRQLGRPPSTTSGRITVTIAESVKMRASLFSLRHRVALATMVEEGLKLFMAQWREQAKAEPVKPAEQPEQLPLDQDEPSK